MMVPQTYLKPYGDGVIGRAYSVLGSLGDVNSQAASMLQSAGFAGATCAPQIESFPGGSWTINACSVPGLPAVTISADTVVTQSAAQLAAEYASYAPQLYQTNQSLSEQLAALTGNAQAEAAAAGGTYAPSTPPPSQMTVTFPTGGSAAVSSLTPPNVQQTASQVTGSDVAALTNTPTLNTTSSTIISGVPDIYVYGGVALLAAFFLMKGK